MVLHFYIVQNLGFMIKVVKRWGEGGGRGGRETPTLQDGERGKGHVPLIDANACTIMARTPIARIKYRRDEL